MDEIARVQFLCMSDEAVRQVLDEMPNDESLYDLAELFKVFGDSTRIRILFALFEAEMCVGDIALLLGLSQTAVSHQLRVLKINKLVKGRKEGKVVFYSLADDHVRRIIDQGMEHIAE
ncbi:MAG: winged helix-turn-helix transcriptional regulator [Clostridia bacterium]|nr:winged helix-turn-helix transcriptional regulator [Clostridia bacterium]